MASRTLFLLLLVLSSLSVGCRRQRYEVASNGPLFTVTNLRLDRRGAASNLNYQEGAILPACTPVQIERVDARQIQFRTSAGSNHRFVLARQATSPMEVHAQRLFSSACPDLAALNALDQAGLQSGTVSVGMTRTGVLLALGYPPEHATPTLNGPLWRYWLTRHRQLEVHFEGDLVVSVGNPGQQTVVPAPTTPPVVTAESGMGCRIPSQNRCYFPSTAEQCAATGAELSLPSEYAACPLAAIGRCDLGGARGYFAYRDSQEHCEMLGGSWRSAQ